MGTRVDASGSKVVKREHCPSCGIEDGSGDNLVVYDDGHKFCYACGHFVRSDGTVTKRAVDFPSSIREACTDDFEYKQISLSALRLYNVVEIHNKGRGTGEFIFPFYSPAGRLVYLKYRDMTYEDKQIVSEGKVSLFGWHVRTPKHKIVCLWEGETDTLSVASRSKQSSYLHLGVPGVQSLEKVIKQDFKHLMEFDKILFCFDNDIEGQAARKQLKDIIPAYKLYEVFVPEDVNDVAEYEGSVDVLLNEAKSITHESLVSGQAIVKRFQNYISANETWGTGIDTGFDNLNEMLGGGLQRGELLLLAGNTGVGKSTFLYDVCSRMESKVFFVPTEMSVEQSCRKLIEIYGEKQFRWHVDGCTFTDEEIAEHLDTIRKKFVFYDDIKEWTSIYRAMVNAIHQYDVGCIVIDVLSDVDGKFTQYETCSQIMRTLSTDIAQGSSKDKRPPVAVIAVCHTVKGKDNSFTKNVSLSSIKGGGSVVQQATCVLAFDGDPSISERELSLLKKSRMIDSELLRSHVEFDPILRKYRAVETRGEDSEEDDGVEVRAAADTIHPRIRTRFSNSTGKPSGGEGTVQPGRASEDASSVTDAANEASTANSSRGYGRKRRARRVADTYQPAGDDSAGLG